MGPGEASGAARLIFAGEHGRAIEEARKAVELTDGHVTRMILGDAYLAAGDLPEAISWLQEAHRLAPWHATPTGLLAAAHRLTGNPSQANSLLEEMGDLPRPVRGRVCYHLHLGELDDAAEWFVKMIAQRDPFALVYANAPLTQPLHRHPRWPEIAGMMRLPRTVTSDRG